MRLYRHEFRTVAEIVAWGCHFSTERTSQYLSEIDDALRARSTRNLQERTSAKKVIDPTKEEVVALFNDLKSWALGRNSIDAASAALYTLIVPRIGCRVIELQSGRIEGGILVLENAKLKDGSCRHIDLRSFDLLFIEALKLLLLEMPNSPKKFKRWHDRIAKQMSRACARIGIRNLCPYSFRHIAIATWKSAGFSGDEIASLVGHLQSRSAAVHYASADVGWTDEYSMARAAPPPVPQDREETEVNHGRAIHHNLDEIFEEPPIPLEKVDANSKVSGSELYSRFVDAQKVEMKKLLRTAESKTECDRKVDGGDNASVSLDR
ncbi:hypothetical protein [Salinarimonas ramus]|uniref:hypothetical protein n=1 Tax=Salinarimonas ramus TaxID=690164 RepID=UPI00166737B7|nr:hypothetical protein [Salinarimonas ramus]